MPFLYRGPRRDPDRFLSWKIALLLAAGAIGLIGMRFENRWLLATAVSLAIVAFALRFL